MLLTLQILNVTVVKSASELLSLITAEAQYSAVTTMAELFLLAAATSVQATLVITGLMFSRVAVPDEVVPA